MIESSDTFAAPPPDALRQRGRLPFTSSKAPRPFPGLLRPGRSVRNLEGLPPSLGRVGSLEIRLAITKKDIRRAQKLRWRVFYEQGKAVPDSKSLLRRRDICPFDRFCDHLFIVDHDTVDSLGARKPRVVGVYRLLRQDIAERNAGFYSATEFDIAPLLQRHSGKRFLELGRSCVLPEYRSKRTLELLWRGIWTYVRHHKIDVLMGCASFDGIDVQCHSASLSFLQRHAGADSEWRAFPLSARAAKPVGMQGEALDMRRGLSSLPPLIKGYLRLGAKFSDGAVVDRQFGTTDVFVVMPVTQIDPRYIEYFTMPNAPLQAAA